jgi:Flp pilus assembly protein TadG
MKRSFLLKQRAGFRADKSGTTAVEFALVGPALVFLLCGIIECGKMLWTQNALQYAVEQAARYAVLLNPTNPTTCGTTSQVQTYAASKVYGQNVSSSVFSLTTPSNSCCVSASLPYATGLPVSINVTLTAQSCRPI